MNIRLILPFVLMVAILGFACSSGSNSDQVTSTPSGSGQIPVENPDGAGRPDSPVITGDARRGAESYKSNSCATCHSGEDESLGPDHTGIFDVAGSRVPGLTAEEYIRQSIFEPDAFIVPGYASPSTMPAFEELTDTEITWLIAYMKTLTVDTEGPRTVAVESLPSGVPDDGRVLYGTIGCSGCHSLGPDRIVGPGFRGVGARAVARKPGLTADEYIIESIVNPDVFIVEGFPKQMPDFDELSEQELADLLAFLKSIN